MARYLLVGDVHLSDRPPSACTDTYLEDLFTILAHTVRLESELDVAGVVWSGDIFHNKQPSRTSHRLVQRAIDLVQRYKRLWIVPGNHDMLNDRFDSVMETQPLGVLFQTGAELLRGWESSGEHPIYGVPWEQRWDEQTVAAALAQFRAPSARVQSAAWHPPSRSLVVAHAPLYPPGQELPYEYYPARDEPAHDDTPARRGWASLQRQGYCYYGHVHEHHGTWSVGSVTFCNQGAITRGSLHESELNRAIAVTVWDPDTGFTRIDVPHKPADEVFRLMEKREAEDVSAAVSDFLVSVGHVRLEVTSVEAVGDYIRQLGLDPDVLAAAEELLVQAQAGVVH